MFNNFRYRPSFNENATPLIIDFNNDVVFERIPEVVFSSNSIQIDYFVDSPREKIVIAYTSREFQRPLEIVLWQGDAYDAIGQWTETDAINRIKEIYESSSTE